LIYVLVISIAVAQLSCVKDSLYNLLCKTLQFYSFTNG